jgi:subtilase family serine protease
MRALADEPLVPLAGSHPANFDFRNRPTLPAGMKLSLELIFAIKHKAEFKELGREIEDPKSPQYRHWLTSEEIHRRFGESEDEFRAVKEWLTSRGFKITRDSYGKSTDWIYFTGTVAQAEETFHVTIVSTGPTKYATTDAMIPARFKGVIGSILGLENFGGGFMLRPLSRGPSNLDFMKRTESAGLHQFGAIPEITIGGITGFAPADFYTFYGAHAQRRNQWCRN